MTMLDDSGVELDAFAKLSLDLGSLKDSIDKATAFNRNQVPVFYNRANVGTFATGSNLGIGLGGPAVGRIWFVRNLVVGGLTWGTTAAGTAEVYVVALDSAHVASLRDMANLRDQAPSLPNIGPWTSSQITVRHPEALHVVIIGGTNAQQYVARCDVEDRPAAVRAVAG